MPEICILTKIAKSHSDESVGSKGLSVPEICLFLCVRLLHIIKYLVSAISITLYVYIYIYIYLYVYVYIYIYLYIIYHTCMVINFNFFTLL